MAETDMPATIAAWHRLVASYDRNELAALIAEDCVFRSPAVHAPQPGKALTLAYLGAAMKVLGPTLSYQRQWYADDSAVLEFQARLEETEVHGVDMISWDEAGLIDDFCVLIRPHRALNAVIEKMAAALSE